EGLAAAGVEGPLLLGSRRSSPAPVSTHADAAMALRRAAEELGPPLTTHRYNDWVSRIRCVGWSIDGVAIAVPSSTSVARRYGGWRAALRNVLGPEFPLARGRSSEYLDEELTKFWE